MAAILPYDDVLRFRDVNNDDTRTRSRACSGESLGIEAVALAVLVGHVKDVKFYNILRLAAHRWECFV